MLRHFLAAYPLRSAAMLLALTSAALAEGVGLAALLPAIGLALETEGSGGAVAVHVERLFALLGLDPSLGALLALVVAAIVLKSLLTLLALTQVGYSAARVSTDLRLALVRALMEARWAHFVSRRAGALASAAGIEPTRAASAYVASCRVLSVAIQLSVYLAIAVAISWEVSLAAFGAGALGMALLHRLVAMGREAGRNRTERQKSFMSRLLQALDGMKTLKAMAVEKGARSLIEKEVSGLNEAMRMNVLSQEALAESHEVFRVLAVAGGLYAFVAIWGLPVGDLLVLALVFARILQKAGHFQIAYQIVAIDQPAFAFVRSAIAAAETAREPDLGSAAPGPGSTVSLRNVSFSHGRETVLDDVSMTLPAGAFVSLVGPSGAGKTTVADLVIGLLRPRSGEVWIGDAPMSDIDAKAWRGAIGYVPQETFLFHDTIAANVALGDPDVSRAEAETALRDAGVWDFVAALPDGPDTVVGERGARLSGGQRQRIAIARALARGPALLILDEATAALDPETEAGVAATVRRLADDGLTVLAISHQSTMREMADIVYRLDKGRIAIESAAARPETRAAAG